MVGLLSLAMCGMTVVMLQEGRSVEIDVDRTEGRIRALQLAETGLARASLEIQCQVDGGGDGLGNLSGTYAGGTFSVTATQSGSDWTLVSTGRSSTATRRVEQGVRRSTSSPFAAAIVATSTTTLNGADTQTDAYDSRLGDYESQATNSDANGTYALIGGHVGSNASISVGTGHIRGNAIPGVAGATTTSGGGSVTGSQVPRSSPLSVPDPSIAEFAAALATNDNGTWTVGDGNVSYNAATRALSISGNGDLTLHGGTYFFSSVSVSGGSVLRVDGPVTIYTVGDFDAGGGSVENATGKPDALSLYVHPHVLAGVDTDSSPAVKISGGSGAALRVYAPRADLTLSGGSSVFGAFVVKTATLSGGTYLHYDVALAADESGGAGVSTMEQLYWRESSALTN